MELRMVPVAVPGTNAIDGTGHVLCGPRLHPREAGVCVQDGGRLADAFLFGASALANLKHVPTRRIHQAITGRQRTEHRLTSCA
ncbi:hypothetical protein FH972_025732 [Carpinus fangiana]|uniref:Uncharacterized protein n=1 Tax=Carpinus fangiana TaxID=176857 RepID=A0A5N6L2A2_9ROSI|nr:hypothetical protein FH972_025732 [Carpinus fangiana]